MNMLTLLSINWNPNPELFNLFGSLPIRYYGLLWVVGIALAYVIVHRQYRDRKIDEKTFEPLFFYCFFGILIGARLGHCLFYQPDYYLNHFWEMILPVKFLPDGGWKDGERRTCQSRRYAGTDYQPSGCTAAKQRCTIWTCWT